MADQSPSSAPLPADLPQRTAASIENWKRKLLDLSRRNRALNFKPARVSTVAIIDEQPAEVFRHLYLEEVAMRFKAAPDDGPTREVIPPEEITRAIELDSEALDYSEGEDALEFVPYDPVTVDERHRDDWLQTRLKADALDHSLRRIDGHARTALEEQGVTTLFLALGMLQYRESPSSDTWFRAPLVLLPVELSRKSARSGYSIVAGDEDAIVNPALAESLRASYGISLPELPDSETIGEAYDLQAFLKGAADAVATQKGWQVHSDINLALFSFQKLVMFKDLEANAAAIGLHRLIRQLLARAGSPIHGLPPGIRTLDLDTAFTPESTHQVVDADSSQMRAAAAVMQGHDIVIEGPPGTGKSQTIISFSNVTFYDSDLHTFPSVVTDTDASGLQFRFVPDGIYEGKGVNLIEARRIADEVVTFARVQLARQAAGEPSLSLGVGTLNLRQQLAILDEIEIRRRAEPSLEPFFDRSIEEPFFVKNLENIQGDERDSIFLSITYGKASDGRLRYNFGPLNRENGWRRLNVLITRARRQMTVFSSIRDHDINPAGATSEGPGLLRAFLAYAEHRRLDGGSLAAAADAESPFERDVCQELMRRGLVIQPQVGVCGYRVDLGVLDDDLPGRFVCGIECDGVSYHSMETVRDRDRLRQQVLEDRGWIIHRVWSTDWFKDRSGQIDRLMALVAEAKHRVRDALRAAQQVTAQTAVRTTPEAPAALPPPAPGTYTRQVAGPYVMHGGDGIRVTANLVGSPIEVLVDAVVRVIEVEGPLHEADVIARLSGFWNTKAGSKIQAAIREACRAAERHGRVQRRDAFYWRADGDCRVRSRAGTGISGDRIAPEEFVQAVTLVLGRGDALQRPALITETRALLGYSRTGPVLEEAIGRAIDALVVQGLLGESSGGLKLRAGL